MSQWLRSGAQLVTVLGLVSAALVLARTRDGRLGLKVLLEFLLAAGLLRLSGEPSPQALLVAALIVVIRRLATFGLSRD